MTHISDMKRKAPFTSSEEAAYSRDQTSSVKKKQKQEILSKEKIDNILKQWDKKCPKYEKEQKKTIRNIKKIFNTETEKTLHILENQLNNFPDINILYNLKKLTYLKLKNNNLSHNLKILDGLTNLVKLDISDNALRFIPTTIFHCPLLEILDLSGNSITKLSSGLWKLKKLKSLNISGNQIEKLSDGIKNLINLETLLICPHPLIFISKEIKELTSLKKLHLMVSTLKTIPHSFWDLKNLEDLKLWVQSDVEKKSNNEIFEIDLKNLQNLKIFHFVGEKKLYTPHKIANLEQLKQLQSLCLKNTSVKFKDLPEEVRNNEKISIDIRPSKSHTKEKASTSGYSKTKEKFFTAMQQESTLPSFTQSHIKIQPTYPEKIISKKDIYKILGLLENVNSETLKQKYKDNKNNIYLHYHPDKTQQDLNKLANKEKRSLTEEENKKIHKANENFQNIEIFYNEIVKEKELHFIQ